MNVGCGSRSIITIGFWDEIAVRRFEPVRIVSISISLWTNWHATPCVTWIVNGDIQSCLPSNVDFTFFAELAHENDLKGAYVVSIHLLTVNY